MHTLFFGNGPIAVSVLRWLKKQPDQSIAGLVVHEPNKRIAGPELIEASGLPNERIFIANTLGSEKTLKAIQDLQPFNGLSVLFGGKNRVEVESGRREGGAPLMYVYDETFWSIPDTFGSK